MRESALPWIDSLLALSREGIALFDLQGALVANNRRLAELFGGQSQLDGRQLDDLFADSAWSLAVSAARKASRWNGVLPTAVHNLEVDLSVARDGQAVLVCRPSAAAQLDLGGGSKSIEIVGSTANSSVQKADKEQTEPASDLYQMTVNALESATVHDTAVRICASLRESGLANVALWLLDPHQSLLRRIAAAGPAAEQLPEVFARQVAPQCDEAILTDRAVPVGDLGLLAGFAAIPLRGREQALGVLTPDGSVELARVEQYAPNVATAVNNAIMADELARANAQLRVIDQQKSEFLNVVAHDLRTPLTCIRTYCDLLRLYQDEPVETSREFLGIISEETVRLGELLDNFLDLARIENATIRYECEPLDMTEVIQHFARVYGAKAQAETVLLATKVAPELPVITADRRRMEQVISNLMSNALKFTPRGGAVTMAAQGEPDGLLVTVEDTGPGVPPEDRTRIFERFRQARNADRSGGGTGLGLAIAKAIVTDHGGRIWVEDAAGGGARFCVWLPLNPPEGCPAAKGVSA